MALTHEEIHQTLKVLRTSRKFTVRMQIVSQIHESMRCLDVDAGQMCERSNQETDLIGDAPPTAEERRCKTG